MASKGNHNNVFRTALLPNPRQFNSNHILQTQDSEITEVNKGSSSPSEKNAMLGWICCAPCIWLHISDTVHKIAITAATFVVTTLLVASPILFLISTAPSRLPKECFATSSECTTTSLNPPTCSEEICKIVASSIHAKIDWNLDPCSHFKNFSCSFKFGGGTPSLLRSIQGNVDIEMQRLLQHNTTSGPFRKLGRLFTSCLRQKTSSQTIKIVLEQLGGYLPMGALGPTSISSLISRINELGFNPLVDIYFDLSYGRRPQTLLIVGGPGASTPILQDNIRWYGPKAPPYQFKQREYKQFKDLIKNIFPKELSLDQRISEEEAIAAFINEFKNLNWTELVPKNWNRPIVIRSPDYIKAVQKLLGKYSTRVAHNSMLIIFTLGLLPQDNPNPTVCTKATMWALPDIASTLFVTHHSNSDLQAVVKKTNAIFKSLKAHLKRAPSLKGAALVKLSSLRIQSQIWQTFTNLTASEDQLKSMNITTDNWFLNILNICRRNRVDPNSINMDTNLHDTWAYPIVARIFYDALSHSIVVPLSVMLVPFFDDKLPPYLQYASVGVYIAKEILRSITKSFEDKAIQCVPDAVHIFSNHSQMDVLIHSGGMQISYHSMLSMSGPLKRMTRLPGLNLTPTQLFFLVSAQELCEESNYFGVNTEAVDFQQILVWLIAQGGSATEVFKCPSGSTMDDQKTCNIL
ncbi:neprilysin-1 isoform X2 [Eurosta solidaginis]|uniref:neprilysin-1 isoform X2 n=1 Tax=Eurosta solidaginis TaxID=178769 RepID=UPI003531412B